MDLRTTWEPPLPDVHVSKWLARHFPSTAAADEAIAGANPPANVRQWLDAREAHRRNWTAEADKRPLELIPGEGLCGFGRLFGGERIPLDMLAEQSWEVDGEAGYYTAEPFLAYYRAAMDRGDEGACRAMAAAVYRFIDEGTDETLMGLVLTLTESADG